MLQLPFMGSKADVEGVNGFHRAQGVNVKEAASVASW